MLYRNNVDIDRYCMTLYSKTRINWLETLANNRSGLSSRSQLLPRWPQPGPRNLNPGPRTQILAPENQIALELLDLSLHPCLASRLVYYLPPGQSMALATPPTSSNTRWHPLPRQTPPNKPFLTRKPPNPNPSLTPSTECLSPHRLTFFPF